MSDQEQNNKNFIAAAGRGDLQEMMRAFELGVDVDAQSGEALRNAAFKGHEKCVKDLIQNNANVNLCYSTTHTNNNQDKYLNATALMAAAANGYKKCVVMLLDAGADPTVIGGWYQNNTRVERSAAEWAKAGSHVALAAFIEDAATGWISPAVDEELSVKTDCVVISRTLGSRVLQEHFNFKSMDRLTLVRKGQNGPVESSERRDFSAIAHKNELTAAFDRCRNLNLSCNEEALSVILGKQILKKAQKVSIIDGGTEATASVAAPAGHA